MNKSKSLLLGMMCKLAPDHEMIRGLAHDSDVIRDFSIGATVITKNDLFEAAPDGKSVFHHKEIWDSLPVILSYLENCGERLTPSDLVRPLAGGGTLIQIAEKLGHLDRIFTPHVWKCAFDAMEDAWYALNRETRRKYDFEKIRNAVAQAEGRETREAQIARYGIDAERVRTCIRRGDISAIVAIYEQNQDRFRKADLFMRDHDNETALDSIASWNNIDVWMTELLGNDDMPTVDDWMMRRGESKTPLERACEFDVVSRIFQPQYWRKNPDEMLRLYEKVPVEKRGQVNIGATLGQIVNSNFATLIDLSTIDRKPVLFSPMNGQAMFGVDGNVVLVSPIMLEKTWRDIDSVRTRLKSAGDDLKISDLRIRTGFDRDTLIHTAIRCDRLDAVLDIAGFCARDLSLDDLLAPNGRGETPLDILIANKKVAQIVKPEIWAGRVQDMLRLWEKVPAAARTDIDFHSIHVQANRLSLRIPAPPGLRRDVA